MIHPPPSADKPAGNQFSLRGLFVFMTALSVILALLALAIREPLHWLGTLAVIAFCAAVIAVMEVTRKLFPPPPRYPFYYLSPEIPQPPVNPLQTMYFGEGESPFADRLEIERSLAKPPQTPAASNPGSAAIGPPPSESPAPSPPPATQ